MNANVHQQQTSGTTLVATTAIAAAAKKSHLKPVDCSSTETQSAAPQKAYDFVGIAG